MNPLQRLIVDTMRRQGWEPKDVEARGVTHATLHRYMNPVTLKAPPKDKVVRQLAEALSLSYDRVWQAAVETVGWKAGQAEVRSLRSVESTDVMPSVLDAIRDDPDLLPEAKDHLMNQYTLLLRVQAAVPTSYAARGKRASADDEVSRRADEVALDLARKNPTSPARRRVAKPPQKDV
jgi:hypothetical protein